MTFEHAADLAAVEEPTLVLTIEARLDRVSTVLALMVPFSAIGALLARMRNVPPPDPRTGEALAANLGEVGIELRAEVGAVSLTAEQVLALQPGDLLTLDSAAPGGVLVYADEVP